MEWCQFISPWQKELGNKIRHLLLLLVDVVSVCCVFFGFDGVHYMLLFLPICRNFVVVVSAIYYKNFNGFIMVHIIVFGNVSPFSTASAPHISPITRNKFNACSLCCH